MKFSRPAIFILLCAAPFAAQPATSPSALEQKVNSVLPAPEEERWLQIPWRTDLMQARADAQRAGKPLFMWIMDGHPLACV
jgi:hypothetical protein